MILSILTFQSEQPSAHFQPFAELCAERYGDFLSQPFQPFGSESRYSAVKPYHSGIFPFLAMDLMIMNRGVNCQLFFGHDLLPYSAEDQQRVYIDEQVQEKIKLIIATFPKDRAAMRFQGYGNRIDIGLNALSTLYMDLLSSLTQVECGVLKLIRQLQFERFGDPAETKTFGLQKLVAQRLGKSPVAIHKSLRSAKFTLLAETATAMKEMMV